VFRIRTEDNTLTRVETGGEGPGSVEPVGDALWVSHQGSNSVAKIDPATGELLATVPVGRAPAWLADAGDGTLLVPNARDDTVSRIDTATNEVIQTIRVGGGPAVFRRAFGDLWLTHIRGETLWRVRVG
jgi:YVTN family beta-propeller protein